MAIVDSRGLTILFTSFTAIEHQPWTNYENNGSEYLIIGAVAHSEYSSIRYKYLTFGNV